MVVNEYALDQLENEDLVEVLELVGIADTLLYRTDRAPKMAIMRSDALGAAGSSGCVVVYGTVVDSSSFCDDFLSFTTLSTTNVADWRSVAAAVDDARAVLDSCSLKRRRRASPPVKEENK